MIEEKSFQTFASLSSEGYENNLPWFLPVPPLNTSLFDPLQEDDPDEKSMSSGHFPVSSESISSFMSNSMD